jgi:hypothetical protein
VGVDAVTLLAIALALAAGVLIGLRIGAKRRRSLHQELAEERTRIDMWNKAGANTLLDEVGPATPRPVQYDQDTERQCNNCHKPAVFAWTGKGPDEGVPFAACNWCISLFFEDGLPDYVVRLDVFGLPTAEPLTDEEWTGFAEALDIDTDDADEDACFGCNGTLTTLDDGSRWCPACTKFWDRPDIDAWPGTADDDTSSTGPRSVPGPRVSD